MRESDIKHEVGSYWVCQERKRGQTVFWVYKSGPTCSVGDSCYGDLSLAVARCDYLAKREAEKAMAKA